MTQQPIRFDDGAAYERMMGAWSQLVGQVFLDWLSPAPGQRWIDVGCGNGSFTEQLIQRVPSLPAAPVADDPTHTEALLEVWSAAEAAITGQPEMPRRRAVGAQLVRTGHRARTAQRGIVNREGLKVCGLSAGGSRIRTCMGLFLSSGLLACWRFFVRSAKVVLRPVACDPVRGAGGRGQGTETVA